ncbi:6897_t:CDS:2 [Funneliformis geosporum]|nr:6897_t:CDS:2 [Funneliformis geosporum]
MQIFQKCLSPPNNYPFSQKWKDIFKAQLSLSKTVSNLHQTLNSIITSLQTDIFVNDNGAELVKKLLEELDLNFILATKFLVDLFDILQ